MSRLLVIIIVIATLFLAGQVYLHWRRRKARALLEHLARRLGVAGRGTRIGLMAGGHRVVLDAQVTSDDRPEELRLTLGSNLPGNFRLTGPAGASHYDDCKLGKAAALGAPFAGWHVRSEDLDQLAALASERRVMEPLEELAALGFTRVELSKRKLRAFWPDFSWKLDDHGWDEGAAGGLPDRVRRAAERLSELATAAEAALHWTAPALHGWRVRATLIALLWLPLLLIPAGILEILLVYDLYPTVRDGQLLARMVLVGAALSVIYTPIAYLLLRKSIQRGARTTAVCLVSFFGFSLGSSGPMLWWNGTGPQGPQQQVTVEVVRVYQESAFDSVSGWLLRKLIGEQAPIEKWSATHRAVVRSWRDESLYGITLTGEQFAALPPENGRLSLSVFPGALGLEWYSEVAVVEGPELPDRNREETPQG
jgi:hypothetical protein